MDGSNHKRGDATHGWLAKFRVAFSGLFWAFRTQSSFRIHLPIGVLVIAIAALIRMSGWQWAVLMLCIGSVLSAELLNTSIELLAARLHPHDDEQIGRALDVAAAAVLIMSFTSMVIGLIVIGSAFLNVTL